MEINSNNVLIRKMVNMLIPLILTNILNVLVYIVNSVWIGRLIGGNGVAAIANCYPMTVALSAVIIAFTSTISVLISQYYGSNDEKSIKEIIGFGYVFSAIIGIIVAVLVIVFAGSFLKILGTPEAVFKDAKVYLMLYSVAFIFNFILLIISGAIRALGNTKMPLIFVGIETVLNIIAVPIFIVSGFGIAGVAIANIIAKFSVLIVAVLYVAKKCKLLKINRRYLKISKSYLKKVLYIGIPVMIEQYIIALIITLEISISNKAGVLGSAAYGVIAKWEQIFLVLSQSLQIVVTILVGQYIGKKEINKVKAIVKGGIKISIIPMLFILFIIFGMPKISLSIFINSEDVIQVAIKFLSVAGFAYLMMPIRLMLNGFIKGTAHTQYLLFSSITSSILEVAVMYILLNIYQMESMVVLSFGVLTYVLTDTILSSAFYFSRSWRKKTMLELENKYS